MSLPSSSGNKGMNIEGFRCSGVFELYSDWLTTTGKLTQVLGSPIFYSEETRVSKQCAQVEDI